MRLKKPKFSRIIIGLILIVLVCILPASSAENGTSDIIAENSTMVPSIAPTNYFITIDPVGNHTIGEIFFINGTTNLPVSESLSMHIQSSIIRKGKFYGNPEEIITFIPSIQICSNKSGNNQWSVNVTTLINKLRTDEYDIIIESESKIGELNTLNATSSFYLIRKVTNITSTNTETTIQEPIKTSQVSSVPIESVTHQSGFSHHFTIFSFSFSFCLWISLGRRRVRLK